MTDFLKRLDELRADVAACNDTTLEAKVAALNFHLNNHAAEIAELVRAAEEVDHISIGGHLRLNEALAALKEKS